MKIIISCSPTLQLIPRNQSGSINTKSDKCLIWVEVNKPLFLCPGSSVRTSRLLVSAQLKETFLLSQLWKEDISKENTFCNHIGIHWQWVRWHIVKKTTTDKCIKTDISVLFSWEGMSRRSRKRFSGTGGISSGRTTGFSLFPLCSFSPSTSFSESCISFSTGLWDAKQWLVKQRTNLSRLCENWQWNL